MSSRFWKNLHPLLRRNRKEIYEDDTNYAILNAIDKELEDLEEETFNSKIQSSLKTATGMFLEEYGDFFGVYRKRELEEDSTYRERIIEAIDIPRGTNDSIKRAIRRYLEDNTLGIKVYEPWKDIFYLNRPDSRLNGNHKLQGKYYHFAVIDVYIGTPFGKDIVSLINDYKPAGVTLHTTYDPSLNPIDSKDSNWGAIPYIRTVTRNFEESIDTYNSLKQPLQGTIKISDKKRLSNIFDLNISDLDGEDVLSGTYSAWNERLHIVSKGQGFNPKEDTQLKDVKLNTHEVSEEKYLELEGKREKSGVDLRPTSQLYFTFNVGTLFSIRHPKLKWFSSDYDNTIKNTNISIGIEASRGTQIGLEVYDFSLSRWEEIGYVITSNLKEFIKTNIRSELDVLNGNKLMFMRITVPKDINIQVDTVDINYSNEDVKSDLGLSYEVVASSAEVIDTSKESMSKNYLRRINREYNLKGTYKWEDPNIKNYTWKELVE